MIQSLISVFDNSFDPLREEYETGYNQYQMSQHSILKRVRNVDKDEIERSYPQFYEQVLDLCSESESKGSDSMWFLVRWRFDEWIPYAQLPSFSNTVVYWDAELQSTMSSEDPEVQHALGDFTDHTKTF